MSERKRLSGLDLLRSLAILLVVCWHYPKAPKGTWLFAVADRAWVGVDLFFVLSGYLIGSQLLRDRPTWGAFYRRRAFRILPCYLTVLALYFLVPGFRENGNLAPLWKFLTFTQNFRLEFGAFSNAWSLCVEEHFYLLLPPIVHAMLRFGNARRTAALLVAILLFGLSVRAYSWLHFVGDSANLRLYFKWIYYPTYNRLDGLLCGVAIALARRYLPGAWRRVETNGDRVAALGVACLVGADALFADKHSLTAAVWGYPVLSLGFACLVASALCPRSVLGRVRVPGAAALATLAFSIYLTHKPMIHLTRDALASAGLPDAGPPAFAASMAVSLAAAALLYFLVERPFLRLRDALVANRLLTRPATA